MSAIKEIIFVSLFSKQKFDKREFVYLSDGGRLVIEYKFVNGIDVDNKPILLFLPGLSDNNETISNKTVINEAL